MLALAAEADDSVGNAVLMSGLGSWLPILKLAVGLAGPSRGGVTLKLLLRGDKLDEVCTRHGTHVPQMTVSLAGLQP